MPEDEAGSSDQLKELLAKIDPEVLQQIMPLTGGVITMMFTDIVDSTKIKAAVGDRSYFDHILKPHNELVREHVSRHNGRELKTIGDAFLVGFARPAEAVACAVGIQERLGTSPIQAGEGVLHVRIGLHTGEPVVYRDEVSKLIDLSGTDVDKAARVEGLARGGQVLISEETKTLAKPKAIHDWGPWELRGLGRHRIFEVLWPGKTPERPSGRAWLEPVRFLTSFVGREAEVARIMDVATRQRAVTLRGMGGIGKTRLADEVAVRVSQKFDEGVFFVELAQTQNSETSVVSELVARLSVKTAGFRNEATALDETLRSWNALLVLDNFEAVMAAAPVVGRLLKGCPGLHFLITSQKLLDVGAEQQIEVQPMVVPAAQPGASLDSLSQLDSFQLFRDRARLKEGGWEVKPDEAPVVAEILELTDGVPLSIELAAARVDSGPLASTRDGLKRSRMEFLKRGGTAVEEKRHAGIQACIDWSFNLLLPDERELLPQLSVFVGGFFAEDAGQVCQVDRASELLDSLRGHSLLVWEESLGKTRYRMLPTVREYAAERVGQQAEELRRRHSQRFLEVLDRADDQIRGKEQMAGIARITADLDNIRAGMETAIEAGDHRMVARYSQAFANYLMMKARFAEWLIRGQQGLAAAQALKQVRLIAHCQMTLGNAYANLPTGDRGTNLQKAITCYEAALRVYTERDFPVDWAMTQNNVGVAYRNLPTGDRGANLQKAIGCYEAALRVYTERDFPVDWAMTQINLGVAYTSLPTADRGANLQKAIGCYEAALRVYIERDFPVQWATTQNNLGAAYADLPTADRGANLQKAIGCYEAALRVRTERDFPVEWAITQINLGLAYWNLPTADGGVNLQKAITCYEAAIRGYEAAGLTNEADPLKRLLARLREQR